MVATLRRARLLACVAAAPAFLWAAPAARADQPRITDERRIGDRTIVLTIATSAFAAPTNVDVILPTGYDADPGRRWPVTYFTAGTMNNYNSFRTAGKGVELTKDYPSIIVSPDGNSGYWSDWYDGGVFGPPRYETFVIEELLPLIDARFRTIADRAHRVIFGVSMGGYGTMMFAARHPDRFSAAATISGAVDSNDPFLGGALTLSSTFDGGDVDAINGPRSTQEIRWRGRNPTDMAGNLGDVDLQVRTANGTLNPGIGEDPASADLVSCAVERGVHTGSVSFHERLEAIGKQHVWRDYGAGCHTPPNFKRQIVDSLATFERHLADPPPDPTSFDFRSMEPRFRIWGWEVTAAPERALEFLRVRGGTDELTLTGSGRTRVATPPRYRGLRRVGVDGVPTAVGADGRVTFMAELGEPHAVQQYTRGAPAGFVSRTVRLQPHAVVRLSARRTRTALRVCARALGGTVRGARLVAGGRRVRLDVRPRTRCRLLRTRAARVTLRGVDAHGHAVAATATARR